MPVTASGIDVEIVCKSTPSYWVINGTRYDFDNVPKTIKISGVKSALTIEAVKRGAKSETLVSNETILANRTGETLTVTSKKANMCFLNRNGGAGGWFRTFDFTNDFKNKATKKTENGGRITVRVQASLDYGEGVGSWKIDGVKYNFNTTVSKFKVTDVRKTTVFEAVTYEQKQVSVTASNCTCSDSQHSSFVSAQIPIGSYVTATASGAVYGHWVKNGSALSKDKAYKKCSFTVHGATRIKWVEATASTDDD